MAPLDTNEGADPERKGLLKARTQGAILSTALSSVGNFAISWLIIRSTDLREVGQYGIAFAVYTLSVGAIRVAIAESVAVEQDRDDATIPGPAIAATATLAFAIALVVSGTGWLMGYQYLIAVGLALPGLALFDLYRYLHLGFLRWRIALAMDGAWTSATLLAAALAVLPSLSLEPFQVFIAWAFVPTCIAGILVTIFERPSRGGVAYVRTRWRTTVPFVADHFVGAGLTNVSTVLVSGIAGLQVVGSLRAAGTALSPANVVAASMRPLIIPAIARSNMLSMRSGYRTAQRISLLAAMPLALICTAVVFLPTPIGTAVFGDNWNFARPLLPFLAIEVVMQAWYLTGYAGHRVHDAGKSALLIRTFLVPMKIGLIVAAATFFGTGLAIAASFAIAAVLNATVWQLSYRNQWRTALSGSLPPAAAAVRGDLPQSQEPT